MEVLLAAGVKGDIRELTTLHADADRNRREEAEALKRRIAELFLLCKRNPHTGELMGAGRHPELADCRRIRFDVEGYEGKPRFRLIYRNEPGDGAPAACVWLAIGPRAALRAHRKAQRRSGR